LVFGGEDVGAIAVEGDLEAVVVHLVRQLNGAALDNDEAQGLLVQARLEVEEQVAFQHEVASLEGLVDLAPFVEEACKAYRCVINGL